jgi:arsenite-transporting ATPase
MRYLQPRLIGEKIQMNRIASGLAKNTFIVPWLTHPPVGLAALGKLI